MSKGTRAALLLLIPLAAASLQLLSCSGGRSALLVRMTAQPPLAGVTRVEVVIEGTARVYPAEPPIDLGPGAPRTLVALLPSSVSGTVAVHLRVTTATGVSAVGEADAVVSPGSASTVDVVLARAPEGTLDLAVPVDFAVSDLGAVADLADVTDLPDLAARADLTDLSRSTDLPAWPDLVVGDLAIVQDLATVTDLAVRPDAPLAVDMAGGCERGCNAKELCCAALCVDPAASTDHCGRCGNRCPAPPNAAATCLMGACAFACRQGSADCDQNPANGCEVMTDSDPKNCGACRVVCPNLGVCLLGLCL